MALWSRPTIGLDIGSRMVKAVELKKTGKNIELDRFGVADIYPDGERPSSTELRREAKIRAIRSAIDQAGIKARNAVTAVAGEPIIVRYIQLPEMSETEMKNALRWEAEEYIPFRVEDVNIDSAVIGKDPDSGRVDVLLVCARKDLIQEHIDLVQEAGVSPEIIDVDSFAFLNCFETNHPADPNEVIGLINMGADITSISVYANGSPRFSRDISIGGNTITSAIQQRLGVPGQKSEQLKIQRGIVATEAAGGGEAAKSGDASTMADTIRSTVQAMTGGVGEETDPNITASATDPNVDMELVDRAIRNTLSNLVGEIRRSIQFFENQSRGLSVARLVVGGGTANLPGLDVYLDRELRLPVETIDPLMRITLGGGVDAESLREHKHLLSVGIGLALRKVMD